MWTGVLYILVQQQLSYSTSLLLIFIIRLLCDNTKFK